MELHETHTRQHVTQGVTEEDYVRWKNIYM